MRGIPAGLVLLATACAAPTETSPSRPKWLEPCSLRGVEGNAFCGAYEVFEDRDARQGRRIRLRVAVLPATLREPQGRSEPGRGTMAPAAPDPIVYFAGGPGDSAVGNAAFVAATYAGPRRSRDIVLVDQRGTGGSDPLACNLYPGSGVARFTGRFMPPDAVEACRIELSKQANLGLYTTTIAVDDVAEVLTALGYDRVNLHGASYGTRMAQVFLRRHPARVRTVILHGVSPLADPIPLTFPRDAQGALSGLVTECRRTTDCREQFENLPFVSRHFFERSTEEPVDARVKDPESGEMVNVVLPPEMVGEAVRWLLYDPVSARRLPSVMYGGAQGQWEDLAEAAIDRRRRIMSPGSIGLYLSVTCAEDLPVIAPPDAEKLAAGTFLGDYRYREQRAACERWVAGAVPAGFHEPVTSDVPTLLLTGALDPVTPPSAAARVAERLPNSKVVIVPFGAHGFGGLRGGECLNRLQSDFVDRGSVDGLDVSCVGAIRPPDFARP